MSIKRQFIAGARCPSCNAEDKVRLCREAEREWIECVACGYESAEPQAPEHPPSEAIGSGDVGIVRFPAGKD